MTGLLALVFGAHALKPEHVVDVMFINEPKFYMRELHQSVNKTQSALC